MADLENQQIEAVTAELVFDKTTVAGAQVSTAMKESPALDLLEAKLREQRRKRAKPYTYRRPTYLQYIEYA